MVTRNENSKKLNRKTEKTTNSYNPLDLFILKRTILFGGFAENDYLRSVNKQ